MNYRLDKNVSSMSSLQDKKANYWLNKSAEERLHASWYLTCCAYGLEFHFHHKLDKTVHSVRSRDNG